MKESSREKINNYTQGGVMARINRIVTRKCTCPSGTVQARSGHNIGCPQFRLDLGVTPGPREKQVSTPRFGPAACGDNE